jgi:hypothetical protein
MSIEEQLTQDWCTALDAEMKRLIPSGSLVTGVKRSRLASAPTRAAGSTERLATENAALLDRLARMQQSTSWRVTAPIRFVGERLKRLRQTSRH